MPTANTVKIGNDITQRYTQPKTKENLSAEWLLNQEFYVSADYDRTDIYPYTVDLIMEVRKMYLHAGDEIFIPLAGNRFDPKKSKDVFELFTEEQITKTIKQEMRQACEKFDDDFLPTALKIALRAQKMAEKLVVEVSKKREKKFLKEKGKKSDSKKT